MNWARILLLQTILKQCAPAETSWVVYSDTDAYIASRPTLAARLRRISSRYTMAFQNGRWLVNSGVHAWRTNNPLSTNLLSEWETHFDESNEDFFAEQNALDAVYRKHRRERIAIHYPNGHLAWHMKGKIPLKVELSSIARRFTACTGPALFLTVLMMTFFITVVVLIIPSPESSLPSTNSKHNPKTSHIPYQYQSPLLTFIYRPLLHLRAAYLSLYRTLTSRRSCIVFVSFVFIVAFLLVPTGRRKSLVELSKWDYHHLLPHGRVMLKYKSREWADAVGHLQGRGVRWRLYRRHSQYAWRMFAGFTLAEIIEWSGVLWIYPLIVLTRFVKWADVCTLAFTLGRNMKGMIV